LSGWTKVLSQRILKEQNYFICNMMEPLTCALETWMPAKSKLSTGDSSFAQWNKKDPVVEQESHEINTILK